MAYGDPSTSVSAVQGTIALDPEGGPWLILSHYHGMWHRRSAEGGACGYTSELENAGVFDLATARSYNNWGLPGGRDEAVPVARMADDVRKRLAILNTNHAKMTAQLARLSDGREDGQGKPVDAVPGSRRRPKG